MSNEIEHSIFMYTNWYIDCFIDYYTVTLLLVPSTLSKPVSGLFPLSSTHSCSALVLLNMNWEHSLEKFHFLWNVLEMAEYEHLLLAAKGKGVITAHFMPAP